MKLFRLLLTGAMIFPAAVFAQEKPSSIPQKGSMLIELNMTPFGQEKVFEFDRLQAKYLLTDRLSLRLGLEFDHVNNSVNESDYPDDTQNKATYSEKSTLLGLHPGIEYRILKNSKISPYVGIELSYRRQWYKSEYTDFKQNYYSGYYDIKIIREVRNAWASSEYVSGMTVTSYVPQAFSSFGANLILGADFFFVKNMYFGFEAGLGYHQEKYKPIELKTRTIDPRGDNGNMRDVTVESTVSPSSKLSNVAFYSNGAIRFGVWF